MKSALDNLLKKNMKEQWIRHFKSAWETNLLEEEEDDHYALKILVS